MWDVIEKLEELDRSDERKELKQGEIVNLLLYTEESNSSVSEDEPKQIDFKEVNEVKIFNYHKDEDLKIERREAILDGICGKAIGICDKKFIKKTRELLKMYDDVLALSSDDLGKSKLLPHSIQLKENSRPIKQRSYRLSKAKADILKEELTKLLNKKLIIPSHSPWSSPVILISKKNGK